MAVDTIQKTAAMEQPPMGTADDFSAVIRVRSVPVSHIRAAPPPASYANEPAPARKVPIPLPAGLPWSPRAAMEGSSWKAMLPWAASLLAHLGFAAAGTLVALVVVDRGWTGQVSPDAVLSAQGCEPVEAGASSGLLGGQGAGAVEAPVAAMPDRLREDATVTTGAELARRAELPAISRDGASASLGKASPAAMAPSSSFMGAGGFAHHIVFVIDRSGSMVGNFDDIRKAVLLSIGKLQDSQDFHVILFAAGKAIECQPRRLVSPTRANKAQAAEFLATARVAYQSDPIPALQRAFDAMDKADNAPGRLIYLLTDGDFPDNEKVLAAVRERNKDRQVHINTYFCGDPNDDASKAVLRQIAVSNGGVYRSLAGEMER